MNMINNVISGIVTEVMNLFAWLSFNAEEWGWCPVKVNNRIDRF